MPSQVIVPHRPGPLVDVPDGDDTGRAGPPDPGAGPAEVVLALAGGVLLAGVLVLGLPRWLSVVAVACLALGLGLPAYAAVLAAAHGRADRRRARTLERGAVLDASSAPVRRLTAAYARLERTAGPGMARDAGHLALAEVAALLGGRSPEGDEAAYVAERAEAVSALADRVADGPVPPVESAAADSLTRIKAFLG